MNIPPRYAQALPSNVGYVVVERYRFFNSHQKKGTARMTETAAPLPLDQLSTSEAIQLAPAMTDLRSLQLPNSFDSFAATYFIAIVKANSDYEVGHATPSSNPKLKLEIS
jgi:hypothetical protein